MGLFERFPYTNFHDLNLTWILNELKTLEHTINEFVSINALKYADPIQWNIISQYEKNTIVIDPLTGTAYISVQPVPSGVALTNTDYWTVVFDLGSFVVKAAKNFCSRYEDATTLTATFSSSVNDWLIWGDTLYRALVNITAGDSYVVDSNIKQFTVEEVVGHIQDLNTTDKSNLVAAINELVQALIDEATRVDNITGDLDNLTTTDKSNLVAAINEVLQTLIDTAGDLTQLTTTDKSNLVAAINEVLQTLIDTCGDLDNLPTSDKTSIVNAISEFYTTFTNLGLKSVKDYGAVGDGVTDDTQAFQDAVDDVAYGSAILVPVGTYILNDAITIAAGRRVTFIGENGNANGSNIKYSTNGAFIDDGDGSSFFRLCFIPQTTHPTAGTAITYTNIYRATVENCNFLDGFVGIEVKAGSELCIDKCSFMVFTPESDGLAWGVKLGTVGYAAPVQIRDCLFRCDIGSEAHGCITCDYTDGVLIQGCTINSWGFAVTIEPHAGHIAAYTFIDNCVIDHCIYHSIYMNTVIGAEAWRNHVSNCWIGESGWTDITLEAAASTKMHDIQIHDNHHYNSPIAFNINSNGDSVYDVNYHDNTIEYSTGNAIQLTSGGSHIKMHDNIFDHCDRALAGNTYTRAEFYHNTEIDCTNTDTYGDRIRAGENAGVSWYDYVPTVTAGSGSIDSYTVSTAKFEIIENVVHLIVKLTAVTTTNASDLLVSMPRACQTDTLIAAKINNKAATAVCSAGYATLVVYDYDGIGSITDGDVFTIEGVYELKTPFDYQ